jgi:hypothetical protein
MTSVNINSCEALRAKNSFFNSFRYTIPGGLNMKIDCKTSLKELMEIAKDTVNELQEGEEFIVKDLFKGFEWNRIDKGNRTKLGSMFFNFSKNGIELIIVGIGKTFLNQQKYRKLQDED